ncbi:hypothetical protein GJ496_009335 [Pomphorhynchus laevis]|nr:hypothetical protein GJ496_009335 [Pomphorhynchus laevis]
MLKALFWGIRPQGDVRVRFAPSPTGPMHIGGLRTALFNFLFAKKFGGSFILRIEDTDQSRSNSQAAKNIIDTLNWTGIKYDEGPYFQSQRLQIYQHYCQQLISENKAYPCFCSMETILASKTINQPGEPWQYDGTCSRIHPQVVEDRLMAGHRHSVRFKMQNDVVKFDDLVYGRININPAKVEGDFVILKSDGWPTYHLACVVDDHLMEISHVLRGVEWQPSTAKHIQLYNALGWPHPVFSHLPILINKDGKKISKRDICNGYGEEYLLTNIRKQGIYPEVILSHLMHYTGNTMSEINNEDDGNSGDTKSKLISIPQMIELFDPLNLNKSYKHLSNLELLNLNRTFIAQANNKVVHDLKKEIYRKWNVNSSLAFCKKILQTYRGRSNSIAGIANECQYLWYAPQRRHLCIEQIHIALIEKFIMELKRCRDPCEAAKIANQSISKSTTNNNYGDLLKLLRTVTTGLESGPPLSDIIEILGFEEFTDRLTNIIS